MPASTRSSRCRAAPAIPSRARGDIVQARLIGIEHGAAAIGGESIAVEVHQVDVRGSLRDTVLEDAGSLIDERVNTAFDDLLRAHTARREALFAPIVLDDGGDCRIRNRMPRAGLVLVPARAGFLAEAAGLAQNVRHIGEIPVGKLGRAPLAQRPTDVEAGQIAHAKRAHRHAEILKRRVDLLRQRARHEQIMSRGAVAGQHAVADEAVAHPGHHRDLAHGLGQAHGRGQHVMRRLGAAHHLEQAHHIGRAEEMQSDHVLGPPRGNSRCH